MDYASDIDLDGQDGRQRRRGGLSFLIVLIGTACLVAAWIMSAGDPYGDLAHRVVEVQTPEPDHAAADSPVDLLAEQRDTDEGPVGLLPDEVTREPGATVASQAEDEAFRQAIGSLPRAGGTHPAEVDRLAALRPADAPSTAPAPDSAGRAAAEMGVPVEEFAAPPADTVMVELTRAQRRAVQRRLGMAGHDAGGTDGVFGPMTRSAIAAYQESAGLLPTGEMDQTTLDALRAETDAEYVAWAEARRASSSSRAARSTAAASVSEEIPVAPGDCARDADGNITGGGVGCSLRGLGGNLRNAFGGGPRDSAGFQPGADR